MEYKVEAIILNASEVKEFDRVYSIFSRDKGRLRIMAKGVRRPHAKLASALEPITRSEIFLANGRMLDKVIGSIIIEQYQSIKINLEKTFKTKRLFDLVERLTTEREPSEELYDKMVFFLEKIGEASEEKASLMQLALIWGMLVSGGYQASIYSCAGCGKKLTREKHCFLLESGVLCESCQKAILGNKMAINEEGIKILRVFSQKNIAVVYRLKVDVATLRNISALLKMILENMLQRKVEL